MGFVTVAALLALAATGWVVWPLVRRHEGASDEAAQARAALTVLREEFAALEAAWAAGELDEAAHAQARRELEARALAETQAREGRAPGRGISPVAAAVVALGVPLFAALGYLWVGSPRWASDEAVLAATREAEAAQAASAAGISSEQIRAMVSQLEARLENEGGNAQAWLMLARSYRVLGDPALVAAGWARLGAKIPQEAAVLTEWAELLVTARGGFDVESTALLERALALAPDEPKALAMGGAAAAAAGEHAKAVERWERLLAQAPAEGEFTQTLRAAIEVERQKAGLPPAGN
ncbi:MAG: c-type cytochrome biogenesis protein CcmI [Rhodocyclales bacterium]|nr:c-type cytochrome biogenesis protein CcmI [Rhodocyclales bacterium]